MVGCGGRALGPRQTVVSIRNFYCRAGFALGFAVAGPAVAADSITEFGRWISRYEAAPANAKPDLVAEGVRLAKRREPAMRRLIATQPSLALQRAGLILESGRLAAPPVPPMLAVHMSKGGKPRLVITGQEGQLYRVETSTDLRRWKAITLFEGTAEPVEFIDETALPERGRFYRTVTP